MAVRVTYGREQAGPVRLGVELREAPQPAQQRALRSPLEPDPAAVGRHARPPTTLRRRAPRDRRPEGLGRPRCRCRAAASERARRARRRARRAHERAELHESLGRVAGPAAGKERAESLGRVAIARATPIPAQARRDAPDVAVDGQLRHVEREGRHGRRRVGPDARQAPQLRDTPGHAAAVLQHAHLGGAPQPARPPVVAEPLPHPENLALRRGGQRGEVREAPHPAREVGDHGVHARLLQHDLGDQHRVGVAARAGPGAARGRPTPRQLAGVSLEVGQQGVAHTVSLPSRGRGPGLSPGAARRRRARRGC